MDASEDSTGQSLGLGLRSPYVSCITIDGCPILPPLMNEARRVQMRNYRDLAKAIESRLQERRKTPITDIPDSVSLTKSSQHCVAQTETFQTAQINIESKIPDSNFERHFIIKKPYENMNEMNLSITSKYEDAVSTMDDSGNTVLDDDSPKSDASDSGGNFASAASSTGTFIIRTNKSSDSSSSNDSSDLQSEGEVLSNFDSNCHPSNDKVHFAKASNKSELRTTEDLSFKTRKRPATYFDSDDSGSEPEYSQFSKSSPSTSAPAYSPNTKSKRDFSDSPVLTPVKNTNSVSQYDITLSNQIPSSAEKAPSRTEITPERESQTHENDSDKENCVSSYSNKRHVRKLSYTLSEPSTALLASGSHTTVDGTGIIDMRHEPNALSTMPSLATTPYKLDGVKNYFEEATPTNQELDNRLDELNRHLAQLQLGLGINKKEHLERYLGEVALAKTFSEKEDDKDRRGEMDSEIEYRFRKLKDTQEEQMAALLEMHNAQQLQLKHDFERRRKLLLGQIDQFEPTPKSVKLVPKPVDTTELRPRPGRFDLEQAWEKGVGCNNAEVENDEPVSMRSSNHTRDSRTSTPIISGRTDLSSTVTLSYSQSHYGPHESLGSVKLSKLQAKMQSMSPNVFKAPSDSRSPLLKGLMFPDPLDRPRSHVRIPAKATDPLMKPKFNRVSATVKGYLTRRLLHTEKIQTLIQTIRDTVDLLLKLYDEAPDGKSDLKVKPQDLDLHRRSLQQLSGACASFHDVFFKLSIPERMAIIATDRERIRTKALKNNATSPTKKNVSTATLRSMERRVSLSNQPQTSRSRVHLKGPRTSTSTRSERQSLAIKAKVSPKRRRMTHFVQPAPMPISKSKNLPSRDTNGNKWRVSDHIRASQLNTTYTRGVAQSTDIYPIETNFNGLGMSNSDVIFGTSQIANNARPSTSHSHSNNSTTSTNSSRFSIGQSDISSKSVGRKSVARRAAAPWK